MDKSSKITLFIIILVIILVAGYAFLVIQKNQRANVSQSEAAQSLQTADGQSPYTDIAGNPVALDDYLGKILIVNSWASWCPFCATELSNLATIGSEYAQQNVQVLAINRGEPSTTAEAFLNSLQIDDGLLLVLDPADRFYPSIAGFTMPETVFYDTQGNLLFHKRGQMSYEELRIQVQKILSTTSE